MRNSCVKKVFIITKAIFQVFTVGLCVFVLVRYSYILEQQHDIQDRILAIEQENSDQSDREHAETKLSYNLTDQVSSSLGIISAGICVFALFGGILSVFNVVRSKELEKMTSQIEDLLENQHELEGARLLQDGIVYASRDRIRLAVDCFDKVIRQGPDTVAALTARYVRLSIYADIFTEGALLFKIQELFNDLQAAVENSKKSSELCRQLMADAYFTLGCSYGKCAMLLSPDGPVDRNYTDASEFYLKEALRYNSGEVDYYRNLAYTYSLIDDIENCKKQLDRAIDCAEQEPLYKPLVSGGRLKKLFDSAWHILSPKMKKTLKEYFSVK